MLKPTPQFILTLGAGIVAAAALVTCGTAHANPNDRWLGQDKAKHFAVSAGLGFAAGFVTNDPYKQFALGMAPGLAKEVYDSRKGGSGFSVKDLAWDAAGVYVGMRVHGLVVTPRKITYTKEF